MNDALSIRMRRELRGSSRGAVNRGKCFVQKAASKSAPDRDYLSARCVDAALLIVGQHVNFQSKPSRLDLFERAPSPAVVMPIGEGSRQARPFPTGTHPGCADRLL